MLPAPVLHAPTVLCVDDEPDILDSLVTYLGPAVPAEVVAASSGPQALNLLEQMEGRVDTVLCDFRMGPMDGLEVLRRVKARWPEVPRIMMTAFPDMHLVIDAVNRGGIGRFLVKPFAPAELAGIVRESVAARRGALLRAAALQRAAEPPMAGRRQGTQAPGRGTG